jgi:hypothetical protein
MKPILFTIFIGIFLFSCKDQKTASKETESFDNTVDTSKDIHQTDSLDFDTSSFVTTNFPDTVHKVLYNGIDTLWAYVDSSFNQADKKRKVFSREKLRQLLANEGFTFDSSGNQQLATKRGFNRRYAVDWLTSKPDTITTQVRYWFQGKKYILIHQKWNLYD